MDYTQCFTNRVDRYKYAIRTYPDTMVDERNFAIERLDLFDGCRILDIGDSGIFGSQCVSIDFEFGTYRSRMGRLTVLLLLPYYIIFQLKNGKHYIKNVCEFLLPMVD